MVFPGTFVGTNVGNSRKFMPTKIFRYTVCKGTCVFRMYILPYLCAMHSYMYACYTFGSERKAERLENNASCYN